ncbi:MAG: acyl-CoA thioesterase [Clostridia bacterium]|nr:acyl-CoA thioesterase [Clostridia bacterium]MBR6647351.1 acyl-CoA thioesterase [Clostridia bacterium]
MDRAKTAKESEIEMVQLVLPNDVNLLGNLKGGTLMHWIDIAAALAASKHSNCYVATAAMDSLDFKYPSKLGSMVKLSARLMSVGKTSMRIKVTVTSEQLQTGKIIKTNEATLVFVALDKDGRPTPVPRLID